MIAKIKSKDNFIYNSYIFAIFDKGWDEKVIIFNNKSKKFEIANIYDNNIYLKRKVFIIDNDRSKFVKLNLNSIDDCFGYEWIDLEFINQVLENKPVDSAKVEIANKMNQLIDQSEWHNVIDKQDAKNLLFCAWNFHDSYIEKIEYQNKINDIANALKVVFDNCWGCKITLIFENDLKLSFDCNNHDDYTIYGASILFDNDYIYWINNQIEKVEEITDEIYFRAKNLKWKIEII